MFSAEALGTEVINDIGTPLRLTTKTKNNEWHSGLFSLKGQFLIEKPNIDTVNGLLRLAFFGQL